MNLRWSWGEAEVKGDSPQYIDESIYIVVASNNLETPSFFLAVINRAVANNREVWWAIVLMYCICNYVIVYLCICVYIFICVFAKAQLLCRWLAIAWLITGKAWWAIDPPSLSQNYDILLWVSNIYIRDTFNKGSLNHSVIKSLIFLIWNLH